MYPTPYGRCELAFYGEMSRRALQRLADAVSVSVQDHRDCPQAESLHEDVRALLAEAICRKRARLRSVFPERSLPDFTGGRSDPPNIQDRLRRVTTCWIDNLMALADDNELDVPRSDGNGRARPTAEIIAEAILNDAMLAGRIAAIQGA